MYILVTQMEKTKAKLEVFDNQNNLLLTTEAFIGQEGLTKDKKEGDKQTPVGTFELGLLFGTHKKEILKRNYILDCEEKKSVSILDYKEKINNNIFNYNYIEINKNLYWVDDVKSKYYNKLVDISNVEKDWDSAEHLISYKNEYEYAIEIKINPKNIRGKGSATFLHCSTGKPTAGCIAIDKKYMEKIFSLIDENTKIIIKENINKGYFEVN